MEPNFGRIANGLRHILNMFAYDERIPEEVFTNDDVDVLCDAEAIVLIVKQESENESKDDFSRGQWKDRLKKGYAPRRLQNHTTRLNNWVLCAESKSPKGGTKMIDNLLAFVLGAIAGGTVGFMLTALAVASRRSEDETDRRGERDL